MFPIIARDEIHGQFQVYQYERENELIKYCPNVCQDKKRVAQIHYNVLKSLI